MNQVYDIFSGRPVSPHRPAPQGVASRKVARVNDRFRRKFSWKTQMKASASFKSLPSEILAEVFMQLRQSTYSQIDFGQITRPYILPINKRHVAEEHSGCLIHAGESKFHKAFS